jgi:hypothetical protein
MSWEAVSAIGGVAGTVAVLLTLLYVARQTSVNTKAVMAQSSRELDLYFGNYHLEVARDPELKRIGLKSSQSTMPEFTDAEWFEFRLYANALMLGLESQYLHDQLGIGLAENSRTYLRIANGMISTFPAWRKWWEDEQRAQTFARGFFEAVNAASERANFDHLVQKANGARAGTTP